MTARFMKSCDASLMRMEGTANGDEYEEEGKFWVVLEFLVERLAGARRTE